MHYGNIYFLVGFELDRFLGIKVTVSYPLWLQFFKSFSNQSLTKLLKCPFNNALKTNFPFLGNCSENVTRLIIFILLTTELSYSCCHVTWLVPRCFLCGLPCHGSRLCHIWRQSYHIKVNTNQKIILHVLRFSTPVAY